MRINRFHLAGVALALVGVTAKNAYAGDVTITTATTTPVQTSAPDGVSPGNVTVNAGGSITVTAGQTAVNVNSNNTVTNTAGTLASNDANNTTGIAIQGFTSTVTNNGVINLLESYVQTDSDSDGDLDGAYALGTNRNGIWLQSGPFTGNIIDGAAGSINIEGNASSAIRLDARLTGGLSSSGTLAVVGDNSYGIAINGGAAAGVSGDVTLAGTISVRGQNSIGLLVDAPIGGALRISSTMTNTAYHSTSRPIDATALAKLDADDFLQSGSTVQVQSGVAGGLTVVGIGIENDTDDDGDGITEAAGDTDDNVTGAITSLGAAPALLIRPNATTPANIVLGATASGYGIVNRGLINGNGIFDGIEGNGMRIEGLGGATVTTAGGLRNDGTIASTAFEANSTALYVGAGVSIPTLQNRKTISAVSTAEAAKTATGIFIAAGANLPTLINTSTIGAQLSGEVGTAAAIVDRSNTLSSITNSGSIVSQLVATDPDPTDNVVPVITGTATAIDLSTSTIGVTINQIADTPFTDDDTVDDDLASRPTVRINGGILLGSGADTINLLSGQIAGNISFGAGADSFTVDNGASYIGKLTDSDGALTLNVANGTLALAGGATNLTTAHFGAASSLAVLLSSTPADSTVITASGTVTFDAGSVINPVVPTGLPVSGVNVFLTANGGLIGASNVTRTVTGATTPYIYNLAISTVTGNPNALQASFTLKSATELGLDPNESAAFNPIIAALRTDVNASGAFAAISTAADFDNTYDKLLPNYASAAAELAATAIQQAEGASGNRLATMRLREQRDVSVWAQEIGYGLKRNPETFGVEYNGYGFGVATGIDGPLRNGALFGLSASFITSEVTQPGRRDGEIAASFGQFNAYLGSSLGPLDFDFVGGAGVGKLSSRRFVEIGSTFSSLSTADWWAYEGHGAIRVSAPIRMGNFSIIPQTSITYVGLEESAYTEEGGGTAIDLDVDGTFSQRLWADVGLEFAGRFGRVGTTQITPRVMLGYRANIIDDAADRTLRFASGGSDFTLIDETEGSGGPLLRVGIDGTNGYSTFSLSYEGEYGDRLQRNSINASLRFRF